MVEEDCNANQPNQQSSIDCLEQPVDSDQNNEKPIIDNSCRQYYKGIMAYASGNYQPDSSHSSTSFSPQSNLSSSSRQDSLTDIIQQHYHQFPLPPNHQINREASSTFSQYDGSDTDWLDTRSSTQSGSHHYLYHRHHPPVADINLFGNLRGDIHNSSRFLRYALSTESLIALLESKRNKTPPGVTATTSMNSIHSHRLHSPIPFASNPELSSETLINKHHVPYPAWFGSSHQHVLPSHQQVQRIFIDLKNAFGFQYDSMLNMMDHFMVMLDSRASRMSPAMALLTLHADYIGGQNANYRKWQFAVHLDSTVGGMMDDKIRDSLRKLSWKETEESWRVKMEQMTDTERVRQLALWLMIWGEASVIRFCPEVLCFIFKLADDACDTKLAEVQEKKTIAPEGDFLDNVVKPLYDFARDQVYQKDKDANTVRRDRDHSDIVGYDDMNQSFWSSKTICQIVLQDKSKLMTLAPHLRFNALRNVNWKKAFKKTFKEKRSWMHLAVNFTRIWIIHVVSFWYYIAANSDILYLDSDKATAEKELPVKISITALGGSVATLLIMLGSIVEYIYVPFTFQRAGILMRRMILLLLILALNAGPSVYCVFINRTGMLSMAAAVIQLLLSLVTSIYFAVIPQSRLFVRSKKTTPSEPLHDHAQQTFTASFPHLKKTDRMISIGLWICVFGCKLLESYFFIALSFKDPLKAIANMTVLHCNDAITGSFLCSHMPTISLVLMLLMELVLFFLDTYLWYVIWNTVFSAARSFYLGISIWSPWRNIFSRLPKRIYTKLLATSDLDFQIQPKILCSQIWNALIVSMFQEHLLSPDHVSKLLYRQIHAIGSSKSTLKSPSFFVSQDDVAFKTEYYPQKSEASRRMQFFAKSLTTPMPESLPVPNMPTFTVMTPHYSEKVILTLREIIREEDRSARITLLEYLKQLHPFEWENFVKDTKVLADEKQTTDEIIDEMGSIDSLPSTVIADERTERQHKINDLPFYCVGFKSASPEYTMRTRIWASLRTQTLFRTITGFMNYQKAIKLLYRVETPGLGSTQLPSSPVTEAELEEMANRKFRFVIAMQRYAQFDAEERESVEYILKAYPSLQIAYLEEEKVGNDTVFYSVLINGHCSFKPDGTRSPKYRIRLPGNPILGDGKSDNQNTALIYYRGEYLQLIDANQDNYLEECIKIRNVLGEFEEMHSVNNESPYATPTNGKSPVAIVGAREYVFSENVGVLGDVAAGKEQTFGTLTQRIMAIIGGRLHYGHPDFLNAIFMTTRGGVSKAQKGLHLNEDIYAGINAFGRGGRIKHIEYFQCGKGRDLGFGSVLNFVTKIGSGMGEQMLSREYYYLGTQLPLDRFLTFFYGHPGFHINNIFIMLSVHLFMFVLLFVAATSMPLNVCDSSADPATQREDCYNLVPIFEWLKRVVTSIFAITFIAFFPLFLQELTERGFFRACSRLCKHMLSFAPLFEIFITQTYANSILNNLTFGGARYIGTDRGFATARLPFSLLYSRFADTSMYAGARLTMLLMFGSFVLWIPHLAYFWFTVLALLFSPFLFNPHQFCLTEFLIDYRQYLRWLSRGNGTSHQDSWIRFCRFIRMRVTGTKRKSLHNHRDVSTQQTRLPLSAMVFSEVLVPCIVALLSVTAYVFTRSFNEKETVSPSALVRVGVLALAPVLLNAVVLLALFALSLVLGPLANLCCSVKFGATVAAVAHVWAVLNVVVFFELLYFLEDWSLVHVVLAVVAVTSVQRFFFKLITVTVLTREFAEDRINQGWWTGRWYGRGLGWYAWSQPVREFVCKTIEMSLFATDFIMGHFILFILFVVCLVPGIDKWHSFMLFWLKSSQQIQKPIYSTDQRRKRKQTAALYGLLLVVMFFVFAVLLVAPAILGPRLDFKLSLPI
ncbi:MAG: putative 1,3-beta-D-glucan synthase subunit [Benjaminiella poitrasii]|nr:MAG: putative 1,3-beta-D-glucan synthase subunit [Benjaminiella poitrasii]